MWRVWRALFREKNRETHTFFRRMSAQQEGFSKIDSALTAIAIAASVEGKTIEMVQNERMSYRCHAFDSVNTTKYCGNKLFGWLFNPDCQDLANRAKEHQERFYKVGGVIDSLSEESPWHVFLCQRRMGVSMSDVKDYWNVRRQHYHGETMQLPRKIEPSQPMEEEEQSDKYDEVQQEAPEEEEPQEPQPEEEEQVDTTATPAMAKWLSDNRDKVEEGAVELPDELIAEITGALIDVGVPEPRFHSATVCYACATAPRVKSESFIFYFPFSEEERVVVQSWDSELYIMQRKVYIAKDMVHRVIGVAGRDGGDDGKYLRIIFTCGDGESGEMDYSPQNDNRYPSEGEYFDQITRVWKRAVAGKAPAPKRAASTANAPNAKASHKKSRVDEGDEDGDAYAAEETSAFAQFMHSPPKSKDLKNGRTWVEVAKTLPYFFVNNLGDVNLTTHDVLRIAHMCCLPIDTLRILTNGELMGAPYSFSGKMLDLVLDAINEKALDTKLYELLDKINMPRAQISLLRLNDKTMDDFVNCYHIEDVVTLINFPSLNQDAKDTEKLATELYHNLRQMKDAPTIALSHFPSFEGNDLLSMQVYN